MQLPSFTPAQRLWSFFGLIGLIIAGGVVATVVGRGASPAPSVIAIGGGVQDCGTGWTQPRGGALTFSVSNSTTTGEEIYLQDASSGKVYGELEGLGAGAEQKLQVVLGDGRYRFACLPDEGSAILGPIVRVAGSSTTTGLTPAIAVVTQNELFPAARRYEAWITAQLPVLQADATALDATVRRGDLAGARRDWLTAHLIYESLGAAYGAFGDADTAINGDPAPGLTAATDPDLTGFHRIEALLWGGNPASEIAPLTAKLIDDIGALKSSFADTHVDVLDVGLRAHEILENAIQFEVTGDRDGGSHTGLATIQANLSGTAAALAPLHDILSSRYADLATTESWLARSNALVASFHQPDGSWLPLDRLSRQQREQLDATLGRTVELLAPVAAICDPRSATT